MPLVEQEDGPPLDPGALTQRLDRQRHSPAFTMTYVPLGAVRVVEEKRTVRQQVSQTTETIEHIVRFDIATGSDTVAGGTQQVQSTVMVDDVSNPPARDLGDPDSAQLRRDGGSPMDARPSSGMTGLQAVMAIAAGLALAWLLSPYSPIAGSYRLVPIALPVVALAIALRMLASQRRASRS